LPSWHGEQGWGTVTVLRVASYQCVPALNPEPRIMIQWVEFTEGYLSLVSNATRDKKKPNNKEANK